MAERSFHRLRRCCLLVVIALMVVLPSPSAAVGVNLLRNMFRNPPTNTRAPQMFLNPFTVDTKTDQRVSAWERLWNPEEQQINLAAKAQGKPPPNIPRQEIPTDDQLPNTKYLADPQNILKNPYLLIRSEGVAPPGQQGKAGSDTEGFGTGQHDHTHVAPPAGASNHTASAQTPTGGSAPTTEHPAASTPAAAAEQQVVADAVHSATASMNPLLTMMAARLNMSVTTTPSGALTAAGTQPSQQQTPAASGPCALVKYTNTKFTGEALLVASAFVAKLNIMNALATSHNLTIMVLKTASEGSVATPKDNHVCDALFQPRAFFTALGCCCTMLWKNGTELIIFSMFVNVIDWCIADVACRACGTNFVEVLVVSVITHVAKAWLHVLCRSISISSTDLSRTILSDSDS